MRKRERKMEGTSLLVDVKETPIYHYMIILSDATVLWR